MPNFKTREDAESWLKTRALIAIRAALRVLPVFATNEQKDMPNLLLLIFRAASTTMYFSILPDSRDGHIVEDIRKSFDAVVADDTLSAPSRAVTDAVKEAIDATYLITNIGQFIFDPGQFIDRAYTFTDNAIAAAHSADTNLDIVGSSDADANALSKGTTVEELATMPLWPDGNAPEMMVTLWDNLKSRLLAEGKDWSVWTTWYDARLIGTSSDKKLEEARVLIPDWEWKKGPAHVNAKIKQLIDQHR